MSFWSNGREFGQAFQNREFRMVGEKAGESSVARKPVQQAHLGRLPIVFVAGGLLEVLSSVALLRIVPVYVFGRSENAGFAFELDLTGRVGSELDLAGFCAEPGHHIPDRAPLIEPRNHQSTIARVFPDPQFMHGTSEDLRAGVAISSLESGIDLEESAFFQGGNGKRNGARLKDFFKLFLGRPPAVFGPRQSGFDAFEFGNPRF